VPSLSATFRFRKGYMHTQRVPFSYVCYTLSINRFTPISCLWSMRTNNYLTLPYIIQFDLCLTHLLWAPYATVSVEVWCSMFILDSELCLTPWYWPLCHTWRFCSRGSFGYFQGTWFFVV
jgi:hypothetical protein